MDEEILDYNEQKEGWVSKMVDWQKEHISDRQMTLILAFIIGLLASVAGYLPAWHCARNTVAAHFGI